MKNKYQRMTKEEKKQCQLFYYRTEKGRDMRKRLIRLLIIGIAGLLFAAFIAAERMNQYETGQVFEGQPDYQTAHRCK